MPRTQGKYKPILLVVIIAVLAILLMTVQIRTGTRPTFLTRPVIYIYRLTHKWANQAVYRFIEVWEDYIWLVGVKQENIELKAEIERLREINNRYLEYRQENQRLRRLLEFKQQANIMVVPAQIIGKDPSSWFRTVIIDKGSDDGINKNQAVVTHQGVVGHIIETTPSAAKVLLICDQNSSVAVLIQRNRAEGIMVGGRKGRCKINYLARTADIQPGDVVITSGLGGIFPKGLMVGKVTQVKKKSYGLFQDAEVQPEVDFSKLEEVLIIH
jgi:rod shape-determining protein MreC